MLYNIILCGCECLCVHDKAAGLRLQQDRAVVQACICQMHSAARDACTAHSPMMYVAIVVSRDLTGSQECTGILLHIIAMHAAQNDYSHARQESANALPHWLSVYLPLHWGAARQAFASSFSDISMQPLETSALVVSIPFLQGSQHLLRFPFKHPQPIVGGLAVVTEKYSN